MPRRKQLHPMIFGAGKRNEVAQHNSTYCTESELSRWAGPISQGYDDDAEEDDDRLYIDLNSSSKTVLNSTHLGASEEKNWLSPAYKARISKVHYTDDTPVLNDITMKSFPGEKNGEVIKDLDVNKVVVKTKQRVVDHMKANPAGDRNYACPVCKEVLGNQHEFTVHIRQHKFAIVDKGVPQSHVCGICCKVLSSASSLDRHMLVHSGERPFKCKYCNMAFTTNGNMHRHMRTHANHVSKRNSTSSTSVTSNESKPQKRKKVELPPNQNTEGILRETTEHSTDKDLEEDVENKEDDHRSQLDEHVNSKANTLINSSKNFKKISAACSAEPLDNVLPKDLSLIEFSSSKFKLIVNKCMNDNSYSGSQQPMFADPSIDSPRLNSTKEMKTAVKDVNDSILKKHDVHHVKSKFLAQLELQSVESDGKDTTSSECDHDEEEKTKVLPSNDFADIQSILTMTSKANMMEVSVKPSVVTPASPIKIQPKSTAPCSPKTADSANASPVTPDQVYNSSNDKVSESEASSSSIQAESTQMKTYSCDVCEMDFKSIHSFRRHNRYHHQNRSVFCCQMCSYTSGDKSTLIRHLRTHNGERPFQCSLCKYSFTTKANCERHIKKRHGRFSKDEIKKSMEFNKEAIKFQPDGNANNEPNKFLDVETACQICNVDLKFNRILRHHMRSVHNHLQDKPYTCKICNLGFSTKNNCCRHVMKRHQDEKDNINDIVLEKMSISTDSGSDSDSSKGFTPISKDLESVGVDAKRPRLTDDELSSIEAIVNLANISLAAPSDQPLDLAVHALDLRVKSAQISSHNEQTEATIRINEPSYNNLRKMNYDSDMEIILQKPVNSQRHFCNNNHNESIFSPEVHRMKVLANASEPLPKNDEVLDLSLKSALGNANHRKNHEISQVRDQNQTSLNIKRPERNGGDLASISQLLMASKQAIPVYFDEEDEMKVQVTPNPNKQKDSEVKDMKKRLSSYSNSPNSVLCPFCQRKFPWASSLRRHILTHTGQKPYKCSKCPLLFTTKSNCERHLFRKHDIKESCLLTTDCQDSNEMTSLMTDRQLNCGYCQTSHVTRYQGESANKELNFNESVYDNFESSSDNASNSEFSCPRCMVSFASIKELDFHLREQHEHISYRCHFCRKSFNLRSACLDHILSEHPAQHDLDSLNENDMIIDQEINGNYIQEHVRNPRNFWPSEDLKKHAKSRSDEMPYSCDFCPKRFSSKINLLHHIKNHSRIFSLRNLGSSDEEEPTENECVDFSCES